MKKGRPISIKVQCILGALMTGPKLCREIADAIDETDLHCLRQNLRNMRQIGLLDREEIKGVAGKPVLLYSLGTGASTLETRTPAQTKELLSRQKKQRRFEGLAEPYDDSIVGPNGGRMVRFGNKVRPSDAGQLHDYMPRRKCAILGE
jgi:hypothetical protein